jgi:hypothetical protein
VNGPREYYSREAIERRIWGNVEMYGGRYGKHDYRQVNDYTEEIMAAADLGDRDFLHRAVNALLNQLSQKRYEKGIADTKNDIRKKLGL